MTTDVRTHIEGRAGRITLTRPQALNALTYSMIMAIDAALDDWRLADIDLLIIEAEGDKAFCAGGDIAEIYESGMAGDLDYGRRFWRDEYRMNAKLSRFPKPVVTFLQGFTMGGGVGVGCHGSHRIVDATSRIAMPECGIGLVPDVGGTLLLARAPGRVGEYLGLTANRMGAGDAIFAGFADHFVPDGWETLKTRLIETGDTAEVAGAVSPAPASTLADARGDIDRVFAGKTLGDIMQAFPPVLSNSLARAKDLMSRHAPLAMAATVQILHRVRETPTIENALGQEYRFTHRAIAQGDLIEGIRAAIIDKDRKPRWRHARWQDLNDSEVQRMIAPLGTDALQLEKTE